MSKKHNQSTSDAGYDIEAGLSPSPLVSPGLNAGSRVLKRFILRRFKSILAIFVTLVVLSYITDVGPMTISAGWFTPRPPPHREHGWVGLEFDDDEEAEGNRPGWGFPFSRPRPATRPPPSYNPSEYILDQDGNHFHPYWTSDIAPMHPDISLLPLPSQLFSEVDISTHLRPPRFKRYPDGDLRQIVSPAPRGESKPQPQELPSNSYAKQWIKPKVWDPPRGDVKRVQWEGFDGDWLDWETETEREIREERRDAVKRGFVWAWQAYKDHAWGHDEIKPIDKEPSDPFNNWGASIVDTLDTLLVMGLTDEYDLCRPHVNQLNFHWVNGRDWSQGYENLPDEDGEIWAIDRDKSTGLPVFETGIRYLGGLIGAYDLSGDNLLLERAVDLANILGKAFETASGLPAGRIDPGAESGIYTIGSVSIAEVGSMSLELIRLSYATGDRKWFDLAHRATEFINERVVPRCQQSPLIPMWFTPNGGIENKIGGPITFGGLADSYYEYLVKAYKLMGASKIASTYRTLYEGSIDAARKLIFTDITVIPGRDLMTIGKYENNRLIHETEHLSCFAGAMLGLGSRLLDRNQDMKDAERFTKTCYWLSAHTITGLQPEVFEFYLPGEPMYTNVTIDTGEIYHPPISGEKEIEEMDMRVVHKDRKGTWRYNEDGAEVLKSGSGSGKRGKPVEYGQKLKGTPPGGKKITGRGINRPETIESIFYMYRLTGDRKWQEKGWKMFVSWVTAAKVEGGFSSIEDVTKKNFKYSNNMESFMFAETLKYHFLLQSEPDLLSLDDYVLNTEAHPLITSPNIKPGSQSIWSPSSSSTLDLGVRGQGTDAQKWIRFGVIDSIRKNQENAKARAKGINVSPDTPGGGGGRGMGGGYVKPGKLPGLGPKIIQIKKGT